MLVTPLQNVALPAVKSLADCADFSKTVEPFIGQFYDLPQRILAARGVSDFKDIYISTNPVISGFALTLVFAQIFFIVAEINKNYSQVDRCWSLLPTVFNAHYWIWANANGLRSPKLDALFTFSCIWSVC